MPSADSHAVPSHNETVTYLIKMCVFLNEECCCVCIPWLWPFRTIYW